MTEEGTVELRIDRFSEFIREKNANNQRRLSAPTYIYGLPWIIYVRPWIQSKILVDEDLKFYLQCNGEAYDSDWKCSASVTFHIVSQKEGLCDSVRRIVLMNFSSRYNKVYLGNIWRNDPNNSQMKRFIKDDTLVLRAYVKAEMPQSIQKAKLHDIASSISDAPDCILIMDNNRIPVHKAYMSFYSEYFKAMFRSDFKEGREDEIVLKEVGYGEMLELLSVIYPSAAPITDKNIKTILKLADRFIMPAVLERCKKELKASTKIISTEKLILARQYNFIDLQLEFTQQ